MYVYKVFGDIYYYKKMRIRQNDVLSRLVGVEYLYIKNKRSQQVYTYQIHTSQDIMTKDIQIIELPNGNMAHICPYKIIKGARAGELCKKQIRGSNYVYCCQHRKTLEIRQNAINKLTANGLAN